MSAMYGNDRPMIHGGDSGGRPVKLDASVNINPYAVPLPQALTAAGERALTGIGAYPDITCLELREAIGRYEHTPPEHILCGSGASELFMAIVHALRPKRALLMEPCFYGYERALRAVGCEIKTYYLRRENSFCADEEILGEITDDLDLMIAASPNNPTGRLIGEELSGKLERRCRETGVVLVMDACFLGLSRGRPRGDIVVNAFTKLMSIPGIRLGYLICRDEAMYRAMAAQLPEWNISLPAQEMGVAAAELLTETSFREDSLSLIETERRYLSTEMRRLGVEVFESDTNFLLAHSDRDVYHALLEREILVRDASGFPGLGNGFFRVAVGRHSDNQRLAEAMRSVFDE